MTILNITYTDNPSVKQTKDLYMVVSVNPERVLKSWQLSLFSFEWLRKDGGIKPFEELKTVDQNKSTAVLHLIEAGKPVEYPVLGIGVLENVEIGIGKSTFLTLAAQNVKAIDVLIRKTDEDDFKSFLSV